MSVRTYNPSVRVGNWNEDIQLEEDLLKDFLEKRENGQLQIQKSSNLALMTSNVPLTVSTDGFLHYGDVVILRCQGHMDQPSVCAGEEAREGCTLAINMSTGQFYEGSKLQGSCGVSGSKQTQPCARNAFIIASIDGCQDGHPLRYGEPFQLRTFTGDGLFLHSDRASFQKSARRSRHQEVTLVSEASFLTQWQVLSFDPRLRLEFEGSPVPANEKVLLNHVPTNQNLAVEQYHTMRTPFGREYELSANTFRDSHRAEVDVNHWIIATGPPGEDICPAPEKQ